MDAQRKRCRNAALLLLLAAGLAVPAARAQDLDWQPFEKALAEAERQEKPVLVDVWAPWCGWCRKMKREVYPSGEVRACLAERFVLTRLDRDDNQTTHRYQGRRLTSLRLAQTLGAEGVPAVVLLTPSGERVLHVSGFLGAGQLRPVLDYVATGAYRTESFKAFAERGVTAPGNGC